MDLRFHNNIYFVLWVLDLGFSERNTRSWLMVKDWKTGQEGGLHVWIPMAS